MSYQPSNQEDYVGDKSMCQALIPIFGTGKTRKCCCNRLTYLRQFISPYCYFHNLMKNRIENGEFKNIEEQHKENIKLFEELKLKGKVSTLHVKMVEKMKCITANKSPDFFIRKLTKRKRDESPQFPKKKKYIKNEDNINEIQGILRECLKYGQKGVECFQIAFSDK